MLQQAPDTLYGFRGRVVISDTKHGAVASKWPRKRGPSKSGYDFYRQKEFGLVASMVASPNTYDYSTAVEMAKNTEQVPRDILMMCAMGTYYTFQLPNGDEIRGYRLMQPNVQYILDQLDPHVGAIAVRYPVGWVALPQGEPGFVLTWGNEVPFWQAPQGGGGGGGSAASLNPFSLNSDGWTEATLGAAIRPSAPMLISRIGLFLQFCLDATMNISVWRIEGSTLAEQIGEIVPIIGLSNDWHYVEAVLPAEIELDAGAVYGVLSSRQGGGNNPGTHLLRNNGGFYGQLLWGGESNLWMADPTPAVGKTIEFESDYRGVVLKGSW